MDKGPDRKVGPAESCETFVWLLRDKCTPAGRSAACEERRELTRDLFLVTCRPLPVLFGAPVTRTASARWHATTLVWHN